jgi:hypothetical protein
VLSPRKKLYAAVPAINLDPVSIQEIQEIRGQLRWSNYSRKHLKGYSGYLIIFEGTLPFIFAAISELLYVLSNRSMGCDLILLAT